MTTTMMMTHRCPRGAQLSQGSPKRSPLEAQGRAAQAAQAGAPGGPCIPDWPRKLQKAPGPPGAQKWQVTKENVYKTKGSGARLQNEDLEASAPVWPQGPREAQRSRGDSPGGSGRRPGRPWAPRPAQTGPGSSKRHRGRREPGSGRLLKRMYKKRKAPEPGPKMMIWRPQRGRPEGAA